jgi:hypothetical protein
MMEKGSPKIWATSVILKKSQRKKPPKRRKFAQSGHPDRVASFFLVQTYQMTTNGALS